MIVMPKSLKKDIKFNELVVEPAPVSIPRDYPMAIKYMGSKAKILDFIGAGFKEVHRPGTPIVDLFSGACAIAGGFGHATTIISNDIQSYSTAIASCYLRKSTKIGLINILQLASPIVKSKLKALPKNLQYPENPSLKEFNQIEKRNQSLINEKFLFDYHLYTKNYSGTWWSAEQCVWIDTLRQILDELLEEKKITQADFMLGLTALMHAMAYSGQGTGHYAQYRDAKTLSSMTDINIYRQKNLEQLFERKLNALFKWNNQHVVDLNHKMYNLDYKKCLSKTPQSTVYADPPYAFVHYSRFYHAIETLYKYDYPSLQEKSGTVVKGRYREDRHQSPFCIKTQVPGAFSSLFHGIKETDSNMVLSYSNTGMIHLPDLIDLACQEFGNGYQVWYENIDYKHKTMGRRGDHSRDVKEALILAKKKK